MKYFFASFNSFEIKLPETCVNACHHSGACDADVNFWMNDKYVAKQLAKLPINALSDELKEYGAWDVEELANHKDNLSRILWIACGNIQEEQLQA